VTSRLATLKARLSAARAEADAAEGEVRRASARRLAELRRLPDSKALVAGLKDPALTPQDREQLARTIAEQLPGRARRLPQRIWQRIFSVLRHMGYRWRGLTSIAVLTAVVAAFFLIAASRSGREITSFDTTVRLTFTFPNGVNGTWEFPANYPFVVTDRSPAVVRLRFWNKDYGYGVADINGEWFALHAYKYNR
jgi:hypothetical protein